MTIVQQPSNPVLAPVSVILNALSVSSALFVADASYQLTAVRSVWGVAGGAAAAMQVEKLTGTTVPGSGTTLLVGAVDLTGAANTIVSSALTATAADLLLAAGDRLGVKLSGVLTGLVGCSLTLTLRRL